MLVLSALRHARVEALFLAIFLAIILLAMMAVPPAAIAEEEADSSRTDSRKVVLVLIDGVSLEDLADSSLTNLHRLFTQGSVGLMNARPAGFFREGSSYLTIGAGSRADASPNGGKAYNNGELLPESLARLTRLGVEGDSDTRDAAIGAFRAEELFFQRTGVEAPPNSIVHLGIAGIKEKSDTKYPWHISPGLLGTVLKENGLRSAVVGNADVSGTHHRASALIAMDQQGIARGLVDSSLVERDPKFLGGSTTDYDRLTTAVTEWLGKSDFLVVELGDTARLGFQASLVSPERLVGFRRQALERADRFLGTLVSEFDTSQNLFILAVPSPSLEMRQERNYLTPVVVVGPGYSSGVLSSPTTRRHGIVANIDVAPTVLNFYGIEVPIETSGRPLVAEVQSDPLEHLLALSDRLVVTFRLIRPPFLSAFVTFGTIVLLLAIIGVLFGLKRNLIIRLMLSLLVLWVLFLPLSSLFQLPLNSSSVTLPVAVNIGLAAVFALLSLRLRPAAAILTVCLVTAVALVADSLTGAHLMLGSFFGSDPIAGGRYYGMGNTYLGVVIGTSLVGVAAWRSVFRLPERVNLALAAAFFLVMAVAVGHPSFGANFGGLITALSASFITLLFLEGRALGLKWAVLIMVVLVVVLGIFLLADLYLSSSQSHAGRAVLLIDQGGLQEIFQIVSRKISMNVRHLQNNAWSSLMMAAIVFLVAALARPPKFSESVRRAHPQIWRGFLGAGVGSLIAFSVNDTGVVAAGTTILYVILPLLYLYITSEGAGGVAPASDAHMAAGYPVTPAEKGAF